MDKKHHIKEPGSAITHFIGMLMAIFAAVPLLIKAAHEPSRIYVISLAIYAASLILLYAASTTYHTFDISKKVNTILKKIDHMMISVLIAGSYTPGMPDCPEGKDGNYPARHCMGDRHRRDSDQGVLGLLSEVGLLRTLYRNGLDLRTGLHPDPEQYVPRSIRMAAGRRNHLHCGRRHLRAEASDL